MGDTSDTAWELLNLNLLPSFIKIVLFHYIEYYIKTQLSNKNSHKKYCKP